MKRTLLLFLLIFTLFDCYASYERMTLPELIDESNLIIRGKITKVHANTIDVQVYDVVKGKYSVKEISVEKFTDWTCASRWTEYRMNQELLMFLVNDKPGKWRPLGGGNEGEIPIESNFVFYDPFYLNDNPEPDEHVVYGVTIYAYKYEVSQVTTAIRTYLKDKGKMESSAKKKNQQGCSTSNPFLSRIFDEILVRNERDE